MRVSIGVKIALGFALALTALLSLGFLTINQVRALTEESGLVEHTYKVETTLHALISDLAQAESSARGYALSNDDAAFQTKADQGEVRARNDVAQLRQYTSDNPNQQARLDRLEPLLDRRLETLQRLTTPAATTSGDHDLLVHNGEAVMDELRPLIAEMLDEEEKLMKIRTDGESHLADMAHAILTYGTIAAFLLIGGAGLLITYSITAPLRILADGAARLGSGDYTHRVMVRSRDEVGELARNFNRMAEEVQERQESLAGQEWLKSGLTRIGLQLQGLRDPAEACRTVLTELATLIGARNSAIYVTAGQEKPVLRLQATYAADRAPEQIEPGQGLAGQCYLDRKQIVLHETPDGYFRINSALGDAKPRVVVLQPAVFDDQVRAVVELALLHELTPVQLTLVERVTENLGIALSTIAAGQRTEELLMEAQQLGAELGERNASLHQSELLLQEQQEELKQTNEELEQTNEEMQQTNEEIEEKASLLAVQKKELEKTNREVERARISLQDKAEQIAKTSRYKSEFLANMSHELRTPLNSLLILSKILGENHDNNLTDKQVQYANTIQSSGHDLLELINEVLDLSRIESGVVEIDSEETPLPAIRDFAERTFRPIAENKHVDFAVEIDPQMPPSLTTDQRRLEQILKNLLANAFKFTEQGSVRLRISLARNGWDQGQTVLDKAEQVVAFAITDTGIGIPADKQKLIFEAFQQADAGTSRKYGGTGLGLSISRELAALLGGTLQVTSTPGEGSTFTLYLPATFAGPQKETTTPTGPAPSRSGHSVASVSDAVVEAPTIEDDRDKLERGDLILLIIEDDRDFAGILRDFAREKGFKAIVAASVSGGIALARELHPSAITLDLHLPDSDGWVALDRLKHDSQTRHIPIHIISADEERERSLRLGAVSHLQKPVTKESFEQALSQTLDFINRPLKRLLIVEDNANEREALVALIGNGDVKSTAVSSAAEAFAALDQERFDCVVLDLGLPDRNGFDLIREIHQKYGPTAPPVIVYTGRELTRQEETELRLISDSIVIKNARSPERLLDETALFLHRVQTKLPEAKRRMIEQAHKSDSVLTGRKVLVVDDDVRNIFAITSALEASQMKVSYAENGQAGIDYLKLNPDVEVVLMDVMMPDMDGFEAIRRIRAIPEFKKLPILSVTAKAMKGDREKCMEAGASDYITKPVDMDQLRSLLRVWLYR